VHIGMTEADVVTLLGPPKQQSGPPLPEATRPPCEGAVRGVPYYREMRQSLFVYYDSASNVVCTQWTSGVIFDPIDTSGCRRVTCACSGLAALAFARAARYARSARR